MKKYVSIDIGGTEIKYGLLDEEGSILEKKSIATEAYKGGKGILAKAVEIVESFAANQEISGVGISTAGMVDTDKGEIFYSSPLIPDYIGTNFKNTIEKRFNIPCEVENDVNCAGLAEYTSGAAKGCHSALILTVGTGIGGSAVINGKVCHGFSGSGCEIGYMYLDGSTFQELGAASVLVSKVAERKHDSRENWNGFRVFEEARSGDEICVEAIDEMVDILAKGISNICYVLNPEIVVLGGGIMSEEAYLKDKILNAMKKYLVDAVYNNTRLAFAKHRNNAGMLGAFYNLMQKH